MIVLLLALLLLLPGILSVLILYASLVIRAGKPLREMWRRIRG